MIKFNINDKVIAKDYPSLDEEVGIIVGIDPREDAFNKYLVKFDSLDTYEGWSYGYRFFINNPELVIEPYEGCAVWVHEDDLEKVENESESEEVYMSKFNINDKVVSEGYPYLDKEVGIIVGIDPGKDAKAGKYFVKFDSLDICSGWVYEIFCDDPHLIIEPYEGCAVWVHEDDLVKVEDECKEEFKEDKHEEDIKMEFDKIRKQKEEIIKNMNEKLSELTLEIKEIEHEIEKIKKEWHL